MKLSYNTEVKFSFKTTVDAHILMIAHDQILKGLSTRVSKYHIDKIKALGPITQANCGEVIEVMEDAVKHALAISIKETLMEELIGGDEDIKLSKLSPLQVTLIPKQ